MPKINYVNNKVCGIEIDNGEEFKANNVICNADPPNVYDKMISTKKNSSIFSWKRKRMQYSMGLFVYYFGTKEKYENIISAQSYKFHFSPWIIW